MARFQYLTLMSLLVFGSAIACAVESDSPDSKFEHPEDAVLLRSFILPNGNELHFYEFDASSVGVLEVGRPATNAVGKVPALEHATPYELFLAVAPEGEEAPSSLVAAHDMVLAEEGPRETIRIRLDELEGFFDSDQQKWFNDCTDTGAWRNHSGSSPIGANCPGNVGMAFYECETNFLPPVLASSYPEYWTGGYRQMRASVCARSGPGYVRFSLSNRVHNSDNWSTLLDRTPSTGGYYYWWYNGMTRRDYQRRIYRSEAAQKRANKSWWGRT